MAEYVKKESVIEWFRPYGHVDEGIPYYGIVTDIREMKPADVSLVVHGRWRDNGIPDSMLCGCSVCGFTCGASSFLYCPMCGARMDGGKDG